LPFKRMETLQFKVTVIKFSLFFFLAALGFELRASCLLHRCPVAWATPLTLKFSFFLAVEFLIFFN
jgi:hypothetical protein